jgi:predicted site-specific integrase-resolvase
MQESPYLKPKAAADYLGTSPSTLAKWRMTGYGPAYACLGTRGPIIYREDDLRAFAEQRRRTSTSEGAPRAA